MPLPEITGRRCRLPVPLIFSRHHGDLAVAAYGLLDVLGGRRGPVEAGRDWLAGRLDCSVGGLKKALASLSTPHDGDGNLVPPAPVFLLSRHRGRGQTAARQTIPGVPFVDLPEWTLGDEHTGPLVGPELFRLYAAYLHLRHPEYGTVAHTTADVAAMLRIRPARLPGMVRALEAAGLVVTVARPGKQTIVAPLVEQMPPAVRERHRDELAVACGQTPAACGNPVEDQPGSVDNSAEPPAVSGPSPHAVSGPSPTPRPGPSIEGVPNYGVAIDLDPPSSGPACAPSALVRPPKTPPPLPLVVTPAGWAAAWCGRCPGPSQRVELNDDGWPTGRPCPRCADRAAERAA